MEEERREGIMDEGREGSKDGWMEVRVDERKTKRRMEGRKVGRGGGGGPSPAKEEWIDGRKGGWKG
jgi:hypothetical protein